MSEFADRIFAPIEVLALRLHPQASADLSDVLVLFLTASFLVAILVAALSVTAYYLLRFIDSVIEQISIWAVRDASADTTRRIARRYVGTRSVLTWLRQRTGVITTSSKNRSDFSTSLPKTPQTALRSLTRLALDIPHIVAVVARITMLWLATPIGLYLAIGSVWVTLRRTSAANATEGQFVELLTIVATPGGVATAAALVAATAVALDHGLTPRLRARNAFLRDRARDAEESLEHIEGLAGEIQVSMDELIEEHLAAYPSVLRSAVLQATCGRYTVLAGGVELNSRSDQQITRSAKSTEWDFGNEPIDPSGPRTHTDRLTEREGHLVSAFERMNSTLGDYDTFGELRRLAPPGARGPLFELTPRPVSHMPSGAVGAAGEVPHRTVRHLGSMKLRDLGKDLFHQVSLITSARAEGEIESGDIAGRDSKVETTEKQLIQQVVDQQVGRHQEEIWEAHCFAAQMDRLEQAIARHQGPRSAVGRLSARFG